VSGDLIDTTEMYLRTVFELEEEGIVPLRARIAERLGHSGPTVSQTVARMERDGLLTVAGDRHLELTEMGRGYATRVMRKHRLAECLLVDVIGMPLEDVHAEACRWEHVMSEAVEKRLLELLDGPTVSPFGNPIPGLSELVPSMEPGEAAGIPVRPLDQVAGNEPAEWVVRRIAEPIQVDMELMTALHAADITWGTPVQVVAEGDVIVLTHGIMAVRVPVRQAAHLFVSH
jgi:DtxR family transcriptional regulator, Mn-dependent transcriptional regulator